ncbi:MAG: hypothetical protein M0C28_41070 [Candidatus Moduliflexus flocculans]|nr:hypothetical protein [Candidatus Moduliflexus flocculans]
MSMYTAGSNPGVPGLHLALEDLDQLVGQALAAQLRLELQAEGHAAAQLEHAHLAAVLAAVLEPAPLAEHDPPRGEPVPGPPTWHPRTARAQRHPAPPRRSAPARTARTSPACSLPSRARVYAANFAAPDPTSGESPRTRRVFPAGPRTV